MQQILSFLDREGKEIILLGDTNCDLSNHALGQSVENNTRHVCDLYELFSFEQLINEPTRVASSSSTIIDHIATTSSSNIVQAGVFETSMSDHFMVFCVRKFLGAQVKDHKVIKTHSLKKFNGEAFLTDVASISWEQIVSKSDHLDSLVQEWTNIFSYIVEKHAPMKTIRVSEKYCPWINNDLKALIRSRDKLKKAAVKSGSPLLLASYRHVRNKVNRLNIDLKRQYFTTKIQSSQGNMKETWKTLNQLMNKRSKSTNINLMKQDGKNISNKKEISDIMNKYFCSVGKALAEEIEDTPNPLLSGEYQLNQGNLMFEFKPIGLQDIREAIGKIKTTMGSGVDGISSFFLKVALPAIENSLALIFNLSLKTGVFPASWKTARVTPIYKDGEKAIKSNYRPISVLPVISKLFEKLVFNQLYQYLNGGGLLYKGQSGFRELHSTVSCLLKNTDEWYKGIDTGQFLGSVFIDLKKAFDTVDHEILCKKLMHYGIRNRELTWFESYLSNRKQFCRVGGMDSETDYIEVGVPQGSCLGPLLFLVYINDLPSGIHNSTVSMYADDTSLSYKSKDLTQLNEDINDDLRNLETWLKGNKISLNVAKTHSMLICSRSKHRSIKNSDETFDLKIRENSLAIVDKTKYLGVQIDQNLDWKEHIKYVVSKVSRAIGFLKYSKSLVPSTTLINLYKSIVEPHFRYCCSVWGCCSSIEKTRLQRLQNRAARIITGGRYDDSAAPLIKSLGWQTVEEMIGSETKIMVFKALNGYAPQYLTELFSRNSQNSVHNLRNTSNDLKLPLMKTATGQRCFSFRGAKYWNSLSVESKKAVNLASFKASFM